MISILYYDIQYLLAQIVKLINELEGFLVVHSFHFQANGIELIPLFGLGFVVIKHLRNKHLGYLVKSIAIPAMQEIKK